MSVGIRFMSDEYNVQYDDESNIIGQALITRWNVTGLEIIRLTEGSVDDFPSESRMIIVYVNDATYRTFRAKCLLAERDGSENVHTISCDVLKLGKDVIEKIEATACHFYLCIFPDRFPENQYNHENDEWDYDDSVYQLKLERYAEWLYRGTWLIPLSWNFSSTMLKPRNSLAEYEERPRYRFSRTSFSSG